MSQTGSGSLSNVGILSVLTGVGAGAPLRRVGPYRRPGHDHRSVSSGGLGNHALAEGSEMKWEAVSTPAPELARPLMVLADADAVTESAAMSPRTGIAIIASRAISATNRRDYGASLRSERPLRPACTTPEAVAVLALRSAGPLAARC